MPSSAGGTWPRLRPGRPWPNSKPPRFASVCALIKRVPQQFCFRLPLVLARRCTLPTESQPASASELGAMAMGPGPSQACHRCSVWLSHFLLPWTHVLHRPTRKICDPACLVLPKGSPAGVLHASHHAPPLFSLFGITGLSPVGPNCHFRTGSWSQLATRFERRSTDTSFPIPPSYKTGGSEPALAQAPRAHLTAPYPGG